MVNLKVQPGAKRSRVLGPYGQQLRIAIAAPPVDGKANTALLQWLSRILDVRLADVSLVSGQTGRDKRVCISGLSGEEVLQRLLLMQDGLN